MKGEKQRQSFWAAKLIEKKSHQEKERKFSEEAKYESQEGNEALTHLSYRSLRFKKGKKRRLVQNSLKRKKGRRRHFWRTQDGNQSKVRGKKKKRNMNGLPWPLQVFC